MNDAPATFNGTLHNEPLCHMPTDPRIGNGWKHQVLYKLTLLLPGGESGEGKDRRKMKRQEVSHTRGCFLSKGCQGLESLGPVLSCGQHTWLSSPRRKWQHARGLAGHKEPTGPSNSRPTSKASFQSGRL